MTTSDLIHFDELENELDILMRDMARAFSKVDPSVKVESGTAEAVAEDFSIPYAEQFIARVKELKIGIREGDEELIREHFRGIIDEYDTVDTVVAGKVEDQTPVEGVNALIGEHRQPIMQRLQEIDEGYYALGSSAIERREKRLV